MNRREFLRAGAAGAPVLLGAVVALPGRAARREPLALVTADTEAHVVAVSPATGRVVGRTRTIEGPRSIQGVRRVAVVGHSAAGAISILEGPPVRVRRVLRGFGEPRYTQFTPDGTFAFVTDSANGEVAVVDVRRARVVHRIAVGDGARHLAIDPAGRRLWVSLGSSAARIVVVGITDPRRPRLVRTILPPFLAHDVGFSPSGRRVWVTAGREQRLAVYPTGGSEPAFLLDADEAPQHVTFGATVAYVASGDGGTVRVHSLADGRVTRRTRVPVGSYNIQRDRRRVLTPSLGRGTLTILDAHGRVVREIRVARAAHDACAIA